MKRILVPIDGSEHSAKALRYLADRRKSGEKADILILNVQPGLPSNRFISKQDIKDYQDGESQKVLGQTKVRALQRLLKADAYADVGDPAETIVKFAKKAGADEIVMAARGLGNLKGLFLGSVATKVVQLSVLPVTIVK